MWGSATGFLSASEAKRDCVANKLYSQHGGWTIILTDSNTDNRNRSVVSRLCFFFIEKFYHPSKHDISTQCRTNVGPLSTPLAQHWSSTGSMCCVCWDPCDLLLERYVVKVGLSKGHWKMLYISWLAENNRHYQQQTSSQTYQPRLCYM